MSKKRGEYHKIVCGSLTMFRLFSRLIMSRPSIIDVFGVNRDRNDTDMTLFQNIENVLGYNT